MDIRKKICDKHISYIKYSISDYTAKEVLCDIRHMLDSLGIEQPLADVELVDDPSIHCVNCNNISNSERI